MCQFFASFYLNIKEEMAWARGNSERKMFKGEKNLNAKSSLNLEKKDGAPKKDLWQIVKVELAKLVAGLDGRWGKEE